MRGACQAFPKRTSKRVTRVSATSLSLPATRSVIIFVATMVLTGVVLQRGFSAFAKAEPAEFPSPSGS